MRKMASPLAADLIAIESVARYTIKYPRMACRYPWTQLDSSTEVFGDANFAGCISTRKSTVGGVALRNGQFVREWSKTMGILVLGGGESELAAVVRAGNRRYATAAIGMVHQLGIGKVRPLSCWRSMGSASRSFGEKFVSPKCQDWRIRVTHKQSTCKPFLRHTKVCNWVPVDG